MFQKSESSDVRARRRLVGLVGFVISERGEQTLGGQTLVVVCLAAELYYFPDTSFIFTPASRDTALATCPMMPGDSCNMLANAALSGYTTHGVTSL